MRERGLILHKGRGFNGMDVVVIATLKTSNRKTGDMVQVWILPDKLKPTEAVKCGLDEAVCGDCRHRLDKTCYVNVGQAPQQVWKTYKADKYLDVRDRQDLLAKYIKGRKVRLGAWGEPVLIPIKILDQVVEHSSGWTGYTHQWARYPEYKKYLMASVDMVRDKVRALQHGWRTFRVDRDYENVYGDEVICPADSHDVQCADCTLCNGSKSKCGKSVTIMAHGRGASKFNKWSNLNEVYL